MLIFQRPHSNPRRPYLSQKRSRPRAKAAMHTGHAHCRALIAHKLLHRSQRSHPYRGTNFIKFRIQDHDKETRDKELEENEEQSEAKGGAIRCWSG